MKEYPQTEPDVVELRIEGNEDELPVTLLIRGDVDRTVALLARIRNALKRKPKK